MARISLEPRRTLLLRVAEWYSRRHYGDVLDPGKALAHNSRVLFADARFEQAVAKFDKLDPVLKELAVMVAAARIGCSWCMDFGYWDAHKLGIAPEKLRAVPAWRAHHEQFCEAELAVMEYAEAMCETEPAVTDEMAGRLLRLLGEAAFVELTFMVGVENLRSRVNSALGLRSQGFADRCEYSLRASGDQLRASGERGRHHRQLTALRGTAHLADVRDWHHALRRASAFNVNIVQANPTVRAVCSYKVLLASRAGRARLIPRRRWSVQVLPPDEAAYDSGVRTYRCLAALGYARSRTSQFRR